MVPAGEGLSHGLRALGVPAACAYAAGMLAVLAQACESGTFRQARCLSTKAGAYASDGRYLGLLSDCSSVCWTVLRALELRSALAREHAKTARGTSARAEATRHVHLVRVAVAVAAESGAIVMQLRGHRATAERLLAHAGAAWVSVATSKPGDGGL